MAIHIKRLSTLAIKNAKPGRHADGGNLYLLVKPDGRKTWLFRYRDRLTSKLRDKGLGPAWDVGVTEARERASTLRQQLREGTDPIDSARDARQAAKMEHGKRLTFGQCAELYIAAHKNGWRNAKHTAQWSATLSTHAAVLTPLDVARIDTGTVLRCLEPIWVDKTETAARVRQRIEAVLGWATVRGLRTGDNPARWKGHLDKLLAQPTAIKTVTHMAALPHAQMGAFMVKLRAGEGLGAKALELSILGALRPGAAAGAKWSEIDLDSKLWTIPGERMKSRKGREESREHVVPLSDAALKLLRSIPQVSEYVFPGHRNGALSTAAMLKAARAADPSITLTSHGFRSTFKDWAAECTNHPGEVSEAALAHTVKNATEAAYRRTKLVERRAVLMKEWAAYCGTLPRTGNVTAIKRKAG
jgi:integrase